MTSRPVSPDHPPIRTDADLLAHWQGLIGPGGFGRRSVWLLWLDEDGRSLPILVPIEDIPAHPDEQLVTNLLHITKEIIDTSPAATAAMLLARPGRLPATSDDLAWAATLVKAAKQAGVPLWPVHLATTDHVRVIAPDDLIAAS